MRGEGPTRAEGEALGSRAAHRPRLQAGGAVGGHKGGRGQRGWIQTGRSSTGSRQGSNLRIGERIPKGQRRDREKAEGIAACLAGGSPRAQGTGYHNGRCPSAFPGDTWRDVMCGVCCVTLQRGHRVVCLACGQGRHVLHERCVVEDLVKGVTPAPSRCPELDCEVHHARQDLLEAVIQADAGLRTRVEKMEV